ncbi:catalase [Pacificimonas flava]|uniref:Catalase n=2 Tax=Pacificimonas TaxID=1960290 RepID=A0A219B6F5_9SPHN|nr:MULTISPECIES: catalase [Pacificimonas]MBZ6379068.1 catalase [Pacificimonas aurantium]OWV33696.1 catalase [Pacificimonas flava]
MRDFVVALSATLLAGSAMAAEPVLQRQDSGAPVFDNQNSKAAGDFGGVMLEDFHLIEKLARFDRERIPERVVHARGTGAHGEFVSNGELERYTRAAVFDEDETTPVFVRFSSVIHSKGSPEWLRDPRGFAVKFYTDEGNWDLVGNNLPVFFIRDAMKFPDMVHSLKPSPITNQQEPERFFDFFSHVPESTKMLTYLYSDLGTPASLRQMDGSSVHSLKLVNDAGEVFFVKFRWDSLQGEHNLSAAEARQQPFSYLTADLYDNIAAGNFPQWDLYAQILTPDRVDSFDYNPFDATKEWEGVPEFKVGTMTLNRVPDNFFEYTEQVAFSPGVMVPGIEPSPDRLLQGRLFSYADTQRYRIGANYQSLPVNRPLVEVRNGSQDGALSASGRTGDVNYQPSRRVDDAAHYVDDGRGTYISAYEVGTTVTKAPIRKTLPFEQAGNLYRSYTTEEQDALIRNLAGDLGKVQNEETKTIMVGHFYAADPEYGRRIAEAVGVDLDAARDVAAMRKREADMLLASAR